MKTIRKRKKTLFFVLKPVLLIIIILIIIPYLISPVYDFPEKTVFSGKQFLNPYENLSTENWLKANFHCHSDTWLGLTAGSKSPADTIAYIYRLMKYDIIGISDYMSINKKFKDSTFYISSYEHGYGFFKVHYLVLGNENVNIIDFLLPQSLSNKQFSIYNLKNNNNLVSIVHPGMLNAFSTKDFEYLTGYDCVEILNYDRTSTKFWDAALSAGNLKYLIADDDSHNVLSQYETAKSFTMINSPRKPSQIINALKKGHSYAVDWRSASKENLELKISQLLLIPEYEYVSLTGDSLKIKYSKPFHKINFIGQDGKLCYSQDNVSEGIYIIKGEDNYIRTELIFNDDTRIYLNPVIRYDGKLPLTEKKAEINILHTILNKIIYLVGAILIASLYSMIRKKKKNRTV